MKRNVTKTISYQKSFRILHAVVCFRNLYGRRLAVKGKSNKLGKTVHRGCVDEEDCTPTAINTENHVKHTG